MNQPMGASQQPPPTTGDADITALVIADLVARCQMGTRKYGAPLRSHNGRDALVDAYQEALDLVAYLRQVLAERAATSISVGTGSTCGNVGGVVWVG